MLFSPDGTSLFVSGRSSGNVAEIDVGAWTVSRVLDAGAGSDGLAYSDVVVTSRVVVPGAGPLDHSSISSSALTGYGISLPRRADRSIAMVIIKLR